MERVDLQRYSGKWYEIARLPVRFQKGCVDTTAEYTPQPDGTIAVTNTCTKADGKVEVARARAWPIPGSHGSRLKVQFFWPFTGLYQVIGLDSEDYSWAVVAGPTRNYLWFLAREPEIRPETYARMLAIAEAEGFDTARLIRRGQP